MIDALSKRYSVLPSKLLTQGDTFDLMVMDVAVTYEKYVNEKANNKVDPKTFDRMYGQEELADKLKRARNEDND